MEGIKTAEQGRGRLRKRPLSQRNSVTCYAAPRFAISRSILLPLSSEPFEAYSFGGAPLRACGVLACSSCDARAAQEAASQGKQENMLPQYTSQKRFLERCSH